MLVTWLNAPRPEPETTKPISAFVIKQHGNLLAFAIVLDKSHTVTGNAVVSHTFTITGGKATMQNGPALSHQQVLELSSKASVLEVIEVPSTASAEGVI